MINAASDVCTLPLAPENPGGRHGRLQPLSARGADIIARFADLALDPSQAHALRIRAAIAILRTSKWRTPEALALAAKQAVPLVVAYLAATAAGDDTRATPEDVLTAGEAALAFLSELKGTIPNVTA
jgi:hypothetical protein